MKSTPVRQINADSDADLGHACVCKQQWCNSHLQYQKKFTYVHSFYPGTTLALAFSLSRESPKISTIPENAKEVHRDESSSKVSGDAGVGFASNRIHAVHF